MKTSTKNALYVSILFAFAFILGFIFCSVYNTLTIKTPDTYYLEAEILSQENEETVFCTEKGNYAVKDKAINPDTLYLLNMATNKTKNAKDDEIVAVFEVVD